MYRRNLFSGTIKQRKLFDAEVAGDSKREISFVASKWLMNVVTKTSNFSQ